MAMQQARLMAVVTLGTPPRQVKHSLDALVSRFWIQSILRHPSQ